MGQRFGFAGNVAKPTPELLKLQADLITAVAPFTVETEGLLATYKERWTLRKTLGPFRN